MALGFALGFGSRWRSTRAKTQRALPSFTGSLALQEAAHALHLVQFARLRTASFCTESGFAPLVSHGARCVIISRVRAREVLVVIQQPGTDRMRVANVVDPLLLCPEGMSPNWTDSDMNFSDEE